MNFWKNLKHGFAVLAPMEDVTDVVFRSVVGDLAPADVFFTEFCNVDAICHAIDLNRVSLETSEVHPALMRLSLGQSKMPLVAQIWGVDPGKFFRACEFLSDKDFAGIDINLGCPEKSVVKQGACGGMIGDKVCVSEIVDACKKGLGGKKPISIKTRIGKARIDTESWIGFLLSLDIDALTIHGRTVKEMSEVPAHWDEITKSVELKKELGKDTIIIGNGDVDSYALLRDRVLESGVDGVMVGRGIFKNPKIFDSKDINPDQINIDERLSMLKKHVSLWKDTWGARKNFAILKKFVKMYINGFEGSARIRADFMESRSIEELLFKIGKIK